jgi:MOSC domain-containing protein
MLGLVVTARGGRRMPIELGQIEALYRYPVKSMRGEPLEAAAMGWHGLDGDRRFALRRIDERGGMPWLTASKLPQLVLFTPHGRDDASGEALPTHVRTPEGDELPLLGDALAADIGRRHGAPVQMMQLRHGIFDETTISVITSDTARELCQLAGQPADIRRFRPNIVVRSTHAVPFEEDDWVGGVLAFGDAADAPAVTITMRDIRCAMLNIHPDDARTAPEVMKAVVRTHQNTCGVYGTVTRVGRLAVGQKIVLHR